MLASKARACPSVPCCWMHEGVQCCHLYQWNRAFSAKTWALTVSVGLLPPLYFPDQACHTVRGRSYGLGGPEKTHSDDSGTWEEGWRRQHIFRLQQGQQDFSVKSHIVNIFSLAAPHSFSAAYSLYVIYPFSDYRFWTHCMLWFATTGPEGRDRGPWVQSPCTMMGGGSTFWEPKTQQESWQGVSVLFPGMRSHLGNTIWKVKYYNFNGNPLQYSCLENPGTDEPGGLPFTGSHRIGYDWSDLAAAARHIDSCPSFLTWHVKVLLQNDKDLFGLGFLMVLIW